MQIQPGRQTPSIKGVREQIRRGEQICLAPRERREINVSPGKAAPATCVIDIVHLNPFVTRIFEFSPIVGSG